MPEVRRFVDIVSEMEKQSMDGLALVFLIPPLILSAVILTIAGTTGQFAVLLCGALLCIPILGLPLGALWLQQGGTRQL